MALTDLQKAESDVADAVSRLVAAGIGLDGAIHSRAASESRKVHKTYLKALGKFQDMATILTERIAQLRVYAERNLE